MSKDGTLTQILLITQFEVLAEVEGIGVADAGRREGRPMVRKQFDREGSWRIVVRKAPTRFDPDQS
jgi:hypothetical protein